MLKTPVELTVGLGARIQARRAAMGITQAEAARRSGVSYSTWRRMETIGKASIEDMVRASLVLRCEHDLDGLFPPLPAVSMDDLLKQQAKAQAPKVRRRARSGNSV